MSKIVLNKANIKEIHVSARRWQSKTYGNTYHTVQVSILVDGVYETVFTSEDMTYGYGGHYMHTAGQALMNAGILTMKDAYELSRLNLEDMGVVLTQDVQDVKRKKDLWF